MTQMKPQQVLADTINYETQVCSLMRPIEVRLKLTRGQDARLVEVRQHLDQAQGKEENDIPNFDYDKKKQMNCLSLYRRQNLDRTTHVQLVICVCAYNENRSMIEKSLFGIYCSLRKFRERNIHSSNIVVMVIFDGIEQVNHKGDQDEESILTFFKRIDAQSGMHNHKDPKDFWTGQKFEIKYKQYCETKKLLAECKQPKRQEDLDMLDPKIKEEYIKIRNELITKKNNSCTTEAMVLFDSNLSKRKQTLSKAYQNIKNQCQKFFQQTDDTSLVYPFQYSPEKRHIENYQNNDGDHMLNVLIVVKHKNAKKLSSHALFFLGFCELIKPEICMLVDSGLEAQGDSIFNMYEHMASNVHVGGSCGFMGVKVERTGDQFGEDTQLAKEIDFVSYFFHQKIFDIQKAQRFEYILGHLLDKPFEAALGFIHVLPGAFSCYRYNAIRDGLRQYLKPVLEENSRRTLGDENMYLAEDRILSLAIKLARATFAYLPNVFAVVDPMATLYGLVAQRRRWINGSEFAFRKVFSERQRIEDKITRFQFLYYYVINSISYVGIGIYFSTIYLTVTSLTLQNGLTPQESSIITSVVSFVYVILVGSLFFLSLNEKSSDARFKAVYYLTSTCLGFYGIMVLILMVINLVNGLVYWGVSIFPMQYMTKEQMKAIADQGELNVVTVIQLAFMYGTVGMYILTVLGSYCVTNYRLRVITELFLSVPHFLFYAPTYLHIFMIYSFCKVDDFTWGTKGLDSDTTKGDFTAERNRITKYKEVLGFILWNIIVGIVLCLLVSFEVTKDFVIIAVGGLFFLNTFIKFIFSIGYLLCHSCKTPNTPPSRQDHYKVNENFNIPGAEEQQKKLQQVMLWRRGNIQRGNQNNMNPRNEGGADGHDLTSIQLIVAE